MGDGSQRVHFRTALCALDVTKPAAVVILFYSQASQYFLGDNHSVRVYRMNKLIVLYYHGTKTQYNSFVLCSTVILDHSTRHGKMN